MRANNRKISFMIHALAALGATALLGGCGNDGGGTDSGQGSDGASDTADQDSADQDSADQDSADQDSATGLDTTTGQDSTTADDVTTADDTSTAADSAASDADGEVADDAVQDDVSVDDSTGADTANADAADATADVTSDALDGVQCGGAKGSFPSFAKACSGDGDCFVAQHQINCCGTKVAIGLAVGDKAAFEAAEALCQSQYPGCGCAQFETMAEDGYSSFNDADFVASCQAGVCRASVPSAKPVCESTGLQKPKAVKACASTSDCTYLLQTIDCCGSQRAVGVAKFAKDALEKAEFACTQQISICDCAPKPVQLEDGLSAGDGLTAVQCDAGSCMTYAK